MTKPELKYRPRWSAELAGYTVKTLRKRFAKLSPWYEFDDLLQEAQVVFLCCRNKYEGVVDNPRWFMALFKTAWHNRLIDLIDEIPQYSLTGDGEGNASDLSTADGPEAALALLQSLRALPLGLRLALRDGVRNKRRFKALRPAAVKELHDVLMAGCTSI